MKDGNKYQEKFLETLKNKIPHSTTLANTLINILNIDKDSVYRRLRGEIPFTFHEVLSIAQHTGISLDNIIGTAYGQNLLFKLPAVDYIRLADSDYQLLENYLKLLKLCKNDENSEFAESSNSLPMGLYVNYPCLTRFYIFKWWYRNSTSMNTKPYHEIKIPKRLEQIFTDYQIYSKYIATTHYLWDSSIFRYLLADIRFFSDMKLITNEEIRQIKNEVNLFLDYICSLCETGQYEETGNRISFYITDINHGITCSYMDLSGQKISMFKAFTINTIMSSEDEVLCKVKDLISSMIRMSTSITVSNEKQRMAFINAQKELIGQI